MCSIKTFQEVKTMQNFFGIELDTANMSLEELQVARNKTREMLSNLEHQIVLRKMANRKHSSNQSSPAKV